MPIYPPGSPLKSYGLYVVLLTVNEGPGVHPVGTYCFLLLSSSKDDLLQATYLSIRRSDSFTTDKRWQYHTTPMKT